MNSTTVLLSLLLSAFVSCKKDAPEDGLPPATRTGRNTGGCLIDGERFVATGWPSGGILGPSPIPPLGGGFAFDSVYYVRLYGQHKGENVVIALFLRYILSHATYSTNNNTGEIYVTDSQHTGRVELTNANQTTGIGSGTFEFTAASTFDRRKTITITLGRFDRKQ